jgi:hypothetical protein
MNMSRNYSVFFATVVISCAAFLPSAAVAANYSVTPLIIDKELEKRDIVEEIITVTNRENRMVRIYPSVNEISVDEGGSIQTFLEPSMVEDRASAITSWLEIGRGRIELQPGESKEVTLTIKVNPEVAAGEYHAFVGFGEGSNRPAAEKQVLDGNAPGTVVRIGVDKVQNQFLRLEQFNVERFVKDSSEGNIQFRLQNPGEDPVVPKGEIIFYDNNGSEVGSVPINEEGLAVESGKDISFSEQVPDGMKMGKYKAFLSVEYGEHQLASLHDTAFFYMLPLMPVIIIFAIILVVAIGLALYIHKKYDLAGVEVDEADEVALYIREGRSESKDHDIDLSNKKDQ